jgi:hypothetical protein
MLRSLTPRSFLGVFLAMSLLAAAAGPLALAPDRAATAPAPAVDAIEFRQEMRRLWKDHITWTRLYIVSVAADLPDQDLAAQRLLRNQRDIGDALKPFYGDEAGDELATLLEEHILVAADLLAAAKAGDQSQVEAASTRWYANADAIAAFLNSANPAHWPRAAMTAEMQMHLELTLREAVARLEGDYGADIAAYDEIHHHILGFADFLSDGVIRQFPERFAPPSATNPPVPAGESQEHHLPHG